MDNKDRFQEFRESQRVEDIVNARHDQLKREEYRIRKEETERAYKKAQEQRRKKAFSKRMKKIAAVLLAGGIGITAIGLVANHVDKNNQYEKQAKEEMQQSGVGMAEAGLSEETIQSMEEFDALFAGTENQNISEQDLLQKVDVMEQLAKDVVKERVANVKGINKEDITISVHRDNENVKGYDTSIDCGNGEILTEDNALNQGPHMPDEMADVCATLYNSYDNIKSNLASGDITKKEAIEELKENYDKIGKVATSNYILGRNGNIIAVDLEQQKDDGEER